MKVFLNCAAALILALAMVGCSTTEPDVIDPIQKSGSSIQSNGAGTGQVDYTFTWLDCDGVTHTAQMTLTYTYYYDPVGDGLRFRTTWAGRGKSVGEDGAEYTISDVGTGRDIVSEDGCIVVSDGQVRWLVTEKGSGKVYRVKGHVRWTINVCTGEVQVEFDDWDNDCY